MAERDEEGRPVATPNAGAFLSPLTGMPPVPSSFIDQRGASVEPRDEAEIERRGRSGSGERPARPTSTLGPGWLHAVSTSVAVWTLCYSALYLVLDAATSADEGTTIQVMAGAVFLALGIATGAAILGSRAIGPWIALTAGTLLGALVVGWIVVTIGATAAVVAIAGALVCLAVAYQLRPL